VGCREFLISFFMSSIQEGKSGEWNTQVKQFTVIADKMQLNEIYRFLYYIYLVLELFNDDDDFLLIRF
jgi:hypothetical protein